MLLVDVWSSIAHYAPWQDIKLSTNNTPLVNYDITVDEECFDNDTTALRSSQMGLLLKSYTNQLAVTLMLDSDTIYGWRVRAIFQDFLPKHGSQLEVGPRKKLCQSVCKKRFVIFL